MVALWNGIGTVGELREDKDLKTRRALAIACGVLAGAVAFAAEEGGEEGKEAAAPEAQYAIIAPLATKSLLLDAARAGQRLVVVGERGHVLLSDDTGRTWTQAKVPTRAALTGVYFVDAQHGWAVGHDEVIVRTDDGGTTWELAHSAPEKEQPLLDIWFKDANRGLAIGAYGTMLASEDGGKTWQPRTFAPQPLVAPPKTPKKPQGDDEEEFAEEGNDMHLNAIVPSADGKMYIAAEAGNLFRSDDDGLTWLSLPSPYDGSFFGIAPLSGDTLIAFGLRGHLFRSEDQGKTWVEIATGTEAMLTDAARIDDSHLVVSGLAGTLLLSADAGKTFRLMQQADRKGNSTVLAIDASHFVAAGEGGVRSIDAGESR